VETGFTPGLAIRRELDRRADRPAVREGSECGVGVRVPQSFIWIVARVTVLSPVGTQAGHCIREIACCIN